MVVPLQNLIANTGTGWDTAQLLELGGVGFVGVIIILLILAGMIAGISLFFRQPKLATVDQSQVATPPQNANQTMSSSNSSTLGISEEHLRVVIAAAVHIALQDCKNTLRLPPVDTAWAIDGRRAIFQSRALPSSRAYQTTRR